MLAEIETGPHKRERAVSRRSPRNELLTLTLAAVDGLEGEGDLIENSQNHTTGRNSSSREEFVIEGPEVREDSSSSPVDLSASLPDLDQSPASLGSFQRVRLSADKLREIKSPFEASQPVETKPNDLSLPPALAMPGMAQREEGGANQGQCGGLKQGISTEIGSNVQSGVPHHMTDDVIVSSMASDRKYRAALMQKQQFPVKRTVHPRMIVQRQKPKASSEKQQSSPGRSSTTAAVAAAAAATAAVTSSEPYLQASQALTSQVAGLVSQLHGLRDRQEADMAWRQRRLQEQVDRQTDLRLNQLERLQEQQADLQARLAPPFAYQNKKDPLKPSTPPVPPVHAHGEILSTPMPRKVTPVPAASSQRRRRTKPILSSESSSLEATPPGGGREREEIVSVSSGPECKVVPPFSRGEEERFLRMEDRLELLKAQLAELRTKTADWRQRREKEVSCQEDGSRSVPSKPVFFPEDRRWLNAQDVLLQCQESRQNLDDNLDAILRQHEGRWLYDVNSAEDNMDDWPDTLARLRRNVASNVEAVRREIRMEIDREARRFAFTSDRGQPAEKAGNKSRSSIHLQQRSRSGTAFIRKVPGKRGRRNETKAQKRKNVAVPSRIPAPTRAGNEKRGHVLPVFNHKPVYQPSTVQRVTRRPFPFPTALPLGVPRQAWSTDWSVATTADSDQETADPRVDAAVQVEMGKREGEEKSGRHLTQEILPVLSISSNGSAVGKNEKQLRQESDRGAESNYIFVEKTDPDIDNGSLRSSEETGESSGEVEVNAPKSVEFEGGGSLGLGVDDEGAAQRLVKMPVMPTEGHHVPDVEGDGDVKQFAEEWIKRELKARIDFQNWQPERNVPSSASASLSSSTNELNGFATSSELLRIFAEAGIPFDRELVEQLTRGIVTDLVAESWRRQMAAVVSDSSQVSSLPQRSKLSTASPSSRAPSTVVTPIATRTPSPASESLVVEGKDISTPSVSPPPPPLPLEPSEIAVESSDDNKSDPEVLTLFKSPFVGKGGNSKEQERIQTPSDSESSDKASVADEFDELVTPQPSDAEKSDADEVEKEESLSPLAVPVETQTSLRDEPTSPTPPVVVPSYSLSGSGGTSSLSSLSPETASDDLQTTSAVTIGLTTDADISEGEYLLKTEGGRRHRGELSEGEYPASPGDVRLTKDAKSKVNARDVFRREGESEEELQGDVRGLLATFLEKSPEETALSATSSSLSLIGGERNVDPFRELLAQVGAPGGENDVSVGEVVGSRLADGDDLSHGEVVQTEAMRQVIEVEILEGTEDNGRSPGELWRAAPSAVVRISQPLLSSPDDAASDDLALAQAAFLEAHYTPSASPLSPESRPNLNREAVPVPESGRALRSLFSKSNRGKRFSVRQRSETAFLPSVQHSRLSAHRPVTVTVDVPSIDEEPHEVTSDIKFSDNFHDDDTYGEMSSISFGQSDLDEG
eukprot:m.110078 g.110078  ORF g.110078 m.110078 type:complete len:1444 (+) comp37386_c0_seq4:89-4420(+)